MDITTLWALKKKSGSHENESSDEVVQLIARFLSLNVITCCICRGQNSAFGAVLAHMLLPVDFGILSVAT